MRDPSRVRVTGPLAPYSAGFSEQLLAAGYTPWSATRVVQVMGHASRWLADRHLSAEDLTAQGVGEIARSRREAGYAGWRSPRSLAPLMAHLTALGVVAVTMPEPGGGPTDELVERYRTYLVDERGLSGASVRIYTPVARRFLSRCSAGGALQLQELSGTEVTEFVLSECQSGGGAAAKSTVTALRSLLGFLHLEGLIAGGLVSAVPGAANRRLASLPKALDASQTAALLAGCDCRTAVGRRDFAILTALVRLGLRVGEVAALGLDDVDWRHGEIVVRGRGGRQERLPLPVDIGEAMAAWLQQGRPRGACSMVFTRLRAPHGGLSAAAVSGVVRRAGRRAGLPSVGGHRLRHTAATEMLRAGAGLGDVGQVLRHRRLATTAIYAKVDRLALRAVTQPWPGGAA